SPRGRRRDGAAGGPPDDGNSRHGAGAVTATRYRVLLIDDEALSRRRLRQLLSAAPDFDVAGECDDARQAGELVRTLRPDVVFLDIRMPHLDGFGVQAALRTRSAMWGSVRRNPG